MSSPIEYPEWIYYPNSAEPPPWAQAFLVVAGARESIDSAAVSGLNSDAVLAHLRPGLEALGYEVEGGKSRAQKIRRPVLYGEQGLERVSYEIDAWHEDLGIVVEVEAGRGTMGNAVYRDLVRTPLIVNARFLALGLMREYRYGAKSIAQSYRDSKALLDAIYASGRLQIPLRGNPSLRILRAACDRSRFGSCAPERCLGRRVAARGSGSGVRCSTILVVTSARPGHRWIDGP